MLKFAQEFISALLGKRSPSDRDDEEGNERPDLKRNKSEELGLATNTASPDVAESAIASVRSEAAGATASADAPKFQYLLKAMNLPQGQVKQTKKYFADLGFSRIDKIPAKEFAIITFDVSNFFVMKKMEDSDIDLVIVVGRKSFGCTKSYPGFDLPAEIQDRNWNNKTKRKSVQTETKQVGEWH